MQQQPCGTHWQIRHITQHQWAHQRHQPGSALPESAWYLQTDAVLAVSVCLLFVLLERTGSITDRVSGCCSDVNGPHRQPMDAADIIRYAQHNTLMALSAC
jgi:hypothetical protein